MNQLSPLTDKFLEIIQGIDLVASHPDHASSLNEMLAATRESIITVLGDFLKAKELTEDKISLIDGFLFLFNDPVFARWHTLNWWEQQKLILAIKEDNQLYDKRAHGLLARSYLAPYIDYSDDMVARSTDQEVKRAWMRKRLVQKECFWNVIDSVSHAAYFQKKYQDQYPALCVLLFNVSNKDGRKTELVLGIDNGTGSPYKKKSRESLMIRFFYKTYRFFFRSGAFYIGGLELGLLETDSELSCHGTGAVVYQGW
jgi:hypothetical protein